MPNLPDETIFTKTNQSEKPIIFMIADSWSFSVYCDCNDSDFGSVVSYSHDVRQYTEIEWQK